MSTVKAKAVEVNVRQHWAIGIQKRVCPICRREVEVYGDSGKFKLKSHVKNKKEVCAGSGEQAK